MTHHSPCLLGYSLTEFKAYPAYPVIFPFYHHFCSIARSALLPISHGWLVNRRCWLVKNPTEMGDLQWLCEIQKGQRTPRVSFFSGCDSKSKSDCSANFENIPINQVESILDTISNIIQNLQLFNKPTIYYTI